MRKVLCGVSVLGMLMFLGAASAKAQDQGKISLFGGYSWTTNSIDNNICEEDFDYCGTTGLQGYTGSFVYNLSNHVGLEANFSGHNGTPTVGSCTSAAGDCDDGDTSTTTKLRQDLYTYTFGPKFTTAIGPFSVFAHVLVGAAHVHEGWTDSECYTSGGSDPCDIYDSGRAVGNGFALKTGGGLDWNHHRWGIRILEVDYVHLSTRPNVIFDGYNEQITFPVTANNIELSTGITLNLK